MSPKSKKQHFYIYSTEAEYRSMASVVAKTIWLLGLFTKLDVHIRILVMVLSGSKSTVQIVANSIFR